ncbi:hypothetical protein V8B97DRAFT_1840878, partial [Scleroderma yunnanense]
PCPVCTQTFPSTIAVCNHLQQDPTCYQRFLPTPAAFHIPQKSPNKPPTTKFHANLGYIYNLSEPNTFDQMKCHEYELQRQENPYYPFSGRDE